MNHKEIAVSFLKMAGRGQVEEAYTEYVASDFIHHNLYFKGDRESLKKAMAEAAIHHPNKSIETKQIIAENDRVMTLSNVIKEGMDIAVVHIFRFENNKIVELWDLGQQIPNDCQNENGAF